MMGGSVIFYRKGQRVRVCWGGGGISRHEEDAVLPDRHGQIQEEYPLRKKDNSDTENAFLAR